MVVVSAVFEGNGSKPQRGTPANISGLSSAFLTNIGLTITSAHKDIYMAPGVNSYLEIVDYCYQKMAEVNPEINTYFGPAIFRHISALMFAKRIEDVSFKHLGAKSSLSTRILIPNNTRIFHPIQDILGSIGVTKIQETSTVYIPTHPLPDANTRDSVSHEYEIEIRRGCAFDWEKLANDAQAELEQLRKSEKSKTHSRKKSITSDPNLINSSDLSLLYEDYDNLKRQLKTSSDDPPKSRFKTLEEAMNAIRIAESQEYREVVRSASESPLDFGVHDPECGIAVGWNKEEWHRYLRFVSLNQDRFVFGTGLPNSITGTAAWILAVYKNHFGYFVRTPVNTISPVDQALAILVPMSTWHLRNQSELVDNWFCSSSTLAPHRVTNYRNEWVQKAICQTEKKK